MIMARLFAALGVHLVSDAASPWFTRAQEWTEGPGFPIAYVATITPAVAVWSTVLVMLLRRSDPDENAYGTAP